MRTSLLKYTFHVLNSCDLRNEHQHSRLTVFLAKLKKVPKSGCLRKASWLFFSLKPQEKQLLTQEPREFQHAKVNWSQTFLFHHQVHKKMLMASENEWKEKWLYFHLRNCDNENKNCSGQQVSVIDFCQWLWLASVCHPNQQILTNQSNMHYLIPE